MTHNCAAAISLPAYLCWALPPTANSPSCGFAFIRPAMRVLLQVCQQSISQPDACRSVKEMDSCVQRCSTVCSPAAMIVSPDHWHPQMLNLFCALQLTCCSHCMYWLCVAGSSLTATVMRFALGVLNQFSVSVCLRFSCLRQQSHHRQQQMRDWRKNPPSRDELVNALTHRQLGQPSQHSRDAAQISDERSAHYRILQPFFTGTWDHYSHP